MKTVSVPIGEARTNLCDLIHQVKGGVLVVVTSHGRPVAMIGPVPTPAKPWRAAEPDDPGRYGDLQAPVMEPRK